MEKEDAIFKEKGFEEFKKYQEENVHKTLLRGVAYPFIRRFLSINSYYPNEHPVEVVLLSKNSPETGIRVFNSIKEYDLDISRGAFTTGISPFSYIPAYNISLFLSTNITDVENAISAGYAAGRFINNEFYDSDDIELRIAFDFDGVLADDESEQVYKQNSELSEFHNYEMKHKMDPHNPGPLADFFKNLTFSRRLEADRLKNDPDYRKILRTSIVTARSAPAHERAINTLSHWGVSVDELFLMGGVDKSRILNILKPQIYFDDQLIHLNPNMSNTPLVHIPFGIANKGIRD